MPSVLCHAYRSRGIPGGAGISVVGTGVFVGGTIVFVAVGVSVAVAVEVAVAVAAITTASFSSLQPPDTPW